MMHSFLRGLAGLALFLGMTVAAMPASAATSPPAERRFDFGGKVKLSDKMTPVWPGFQGVTDSDVYSPQRGFGWVLDPSNKRQFADLPLRLLRGHVNPDDLTGDAVIWYGGDKPLRLRVDLPNGKYEICLWTGGLMGSAIYDRGDYAISVGDEVKIKVHRGKEWLRKRLFWEFGNQYEWRPGSNPWKQYVEQQYVDFHRFETTVSNGYLDLGFIMARQGERTNPEEVARYLMINALVIYPTDKMSDLNALLAGIQAGRDKQFNEIARLVPPPQKVGTLPAISSKDQAAGYVPFVRGIMEKLNYNSVPEAKEIDRPLTLEAARGQRAFGRFAIYPLKDLKGVTLAISPLVNDAGKTLAADAVKWSWFRYHDQEVYYQRRKDMDYRPLPMLLMPAAASDAVRGVPRAFGVAVTPPKNAAPGEYHGTIRIQPADAPAMDLPIQVTVWPFELNDYPNDDERIFIYSLQRIYERYGSQWLSRDQIWDRVDGDLKLMKEYDIAPTAMFDWNTSMEDLKRFMALYLKYNFRGHPLFGGYEMTRMIDKHAKDPQKVKLDFQPYIKKMREVIAEQKKNNWPEFAFYCSAEIHLGMPGFQAAKSGLDEMKKAVPDAVLVALTNEPAELRVLANSGADILGPNAISMTPDGTELVRESGKKLWFYAWGRNRFRSGLIDWRVGSRGGLHEWYSITLMAPFNPFDSTQFDSTNDAPPFIGPDGPIPTLGMEETTAGRLDFLYLATLDRSIEAARKAKNPAAAEALKRAEALIESVKQRVKPDYYYYYQRQKQIAGTINSIDVPEDKIFGWAPADYDQLRHQIAERISELQKTTGMDNGGGSADAGQRAAGSAH